MIVVSNVYAPDMLREWLAGDVRDYPRENVLKARRFLELVEKNRLGRAFDGALSEEFPKGTDEDEYKEFLFDRDNLEGIAEAIGLQWD